MAIDLSSLIGPAVTLGSAVAQPILTGNAINNATTALVQGGQQAQQQIQTGANQAQLTLGTALQPYMQTGEAALPNLTAGVAPGGEYNTPFNASTFNLYQDPSYQWRLQQGQKAIQAAKLASGEGYSGATLKALNDYTQGAASQEYQNAFNRYQTDIGGLYQRQMGVAQLGAGAANTFGTNVAAIQTSTANAIAEVQQGIANAIAAGDYNRAASLNQMLTSLQSPTSSAAVQSILKQLGLGGGGGTTPGDPGTATVPASSTNMAGGATNPATSPGLTSPDVAASGVGGESATTGTYGAVTNLPSSTYTGDVTGGAGAAAAPTSALDTGAAGDVVSNLPGSIGTYAGPIAGLGTGATMASAAAPAIDLSTVGAAAAGSPLAGTGVLAAGDLSAGAAPAASSGILGSLGSLGTAATSLLTNPITWAVGGGLLAAGLIIKSMQVHPVADTFVQTYQNPFSKAAGNALDSFASTIKSGQMTQDQAVQAYQGMQSMLSQYQNQLQSFAKQGSKQAIVAKQAQQTFDQWYGQNGSTTLGYMQQLINQYLPGTSLS